VWVKISETALKNKGFLSFGVRDLPTLFSEEP